MLDVDGLRKHIKTGLATEALQLRLDAAYQAIDRHVGGTGNVTELLPAGPGPLLRLSRPASAIVSVKERGIVLGADDYRLTGQLLARTTDGSHPARSWRNAIEVTYTPDVDEADRDRVAIALVQLDLNHQPGLTQREIGDWAETFASNSVFNYRIERDAILATLESRVGIF